MLNVLSSITEIFERGLTGSQWQVQSRKRERERNASERLNIVHGHFGQLSPHSKSEQEIMAVKRKSMHGKGRRLVPIPSEVKLEVGAAVGRFNQDRFTRGDCYYGPRFKGKHCYLYRSDYGSVGPISFA